MIEPYVALRALHIGCVALSVTLFAGRGLRMAAGLPQPHHLLLRVLPHVVDTVLLGSAVMLSIRLQQYPFTHAWLSAKVLALLLYIILGSIALKRGRTRAQRLGAFGAALVTVAYIFSVARTHSPWGFLLPLA